MLQKELTAANSTWEIADFHEEKRVSDDFHQQIRFKAIIFFQNLKIGIFFPPIHIPSFLLACISISFTEKAVIRPEWHFAVSEPDFATPVKLLPWGQRWWAYAYLRTDYTVQVYMRCRGCISTANSDNM